MEDIIRSDLQGVGHDREDSHPFGPHLTEEESDISHTTPDIRDKLRFEKSKDLAEVSGIVYLLRELPFMPLLVL